MKPDCVVFLGDLIGKYNKEDCQGSRFTDLFLDESSFADDFKYQRYFTRFMKIFPLHEGIQMIYLPGDNDIGGEGTEMVKPSKVKRFNNYFENRSQWKLKNQLNFYHINRIIHELPMLPDEEAPQVRICG